MKNLKVFAIGVVAMFVAASGVFAATDELSTCLNGADASCNITVEAGKVLTLGATTISKDTTINIEGAGLILNDTLTVNAGKTLTINGSDSNINATKIDNNAKNVIIVNAGANLNLNGVNLKAKTSPYSSDNNYAIIKVMGTTQNSKVSISADTKISGYNTAIAVFGNYVTVDMAGTIAVSDNGIAVSGTLKTDGHRSVLNLTGTVSSTKAAAVYAGGFADWNITGGSYTGLDALSIKAGKVVVSGGTFTATGTNQTPVPNTNGEELTGAAVSITTNSSYAGDVEVEITDGTFKSTKGYAVYEDGNASSNVTSLKVTGGDFTSATPAVVSVADKTGFIYGGTYNSTNANPVKLDDQYLAKGLGSFVDDEGNVVLATKYVVDVNSIHNLTKEAFKTTKTEVVAGETVDLAKIMCEAASVADCTKYKFAYTYTLGLARTSESGLNTFVMPDSDVTVDVTISNRVQFTYKVLSVKNNASLKLNNIIGSHKVYEGDVIDLPTLLLGAGNVNKYVVVYTAKYNGQTVTGKGKFTMPSADVELTLEVFVKGEEPTLTPEDQKPDTPVNPDGGTTPNPDDAKNPNTLDNEMSIVTMGGISLAIAAAGIIALKKREN